MSTSTQWEYRVETLGSTFRGIKDEELEAILDAWGEERWEVISVNPATNSGKVQLVAKRPLSSTERRRRSRPGWNW